MERPVDRRDTSLVVGDALLQPRPLGFSNIRIEPVEIRLTHGCHCPPYLRKGGSVEA